MRLLICTQVMDKNHPILGFFHRWVEEFAKHCEEVHVICLFEGEHALPANVMVHSLGKEEGESRLKYFVRFYGYIWKLRDRYGSIFVHMNQIYVILGWPVWKLLGKRIGLWYAHGAVSMSLRVATLLTDAVFTPSKESFRLQSTKIAHTGHGIDTALFSPQDVVKDIDLITVGRIAPSKNLLGIIDVLAEVQTDARPITLTIVGEAISQKDQEYKEELLTRIREHDLMPLVHFVGAVQQVDLPNLLNRSKVFVTMAQNGSLDKAILEALSCEVAIVASAEGASLLPLGDWFIDNPKDIAGSIKSVMSENNSKKINDLREYVESNHSLFSLIPRILNVLCINNK